jgi:phosphatidylserine decarboxylase
LIVKEAFPLILLNVTLLVASLILYPPLSLFFVVTGVFTALFFRDPPREIQHGVISPADGRIDYLTKKRVEIFMSPFDCHVNRAPVGGRVARIRFQEGKTPPAFKREKNVRMKEITIENDDGIFRVILIAGIFARRIVCYVREGSTVEKGDKIGMIRFGSRVVLEVPEGYRFVKRVGEKVKAGETIAVKDENI